MSDVLGGYLVVQTMKKLGVDAIFGMPGFQLMSVYDGLCQIDGCPRHILIHDEKCGAFMAYGYARVSKKPGVCDATVGPGATNLTSGIAEAFYSSTPMVAMTSDVRMEFVGKSPNQECDQSSIFRPIVKRNLTVHLPERIIESTIRAFQLAATGRPGPVHLNLPENINYTPIEFEWRSRIENLTPIYYPMNRPRPEAALVEKAVEALKKAKNPVCIAGGGVHLADAQEALTKLAETLGLPVATSLTGKGAIPENHPLCLSMCGRFDRYANQFIKEADLILAVGTKLGELVTSRWSVVSPGTPIIHLDVDPAEMDRNYHAQIPLVGDARSGLEDILTAWGPATKQDPAKREIALKIAEAKKNWEESVRHLTHDDKTPANPARILRGIKEFLGDEGLLAVDGGLATHWAGLFYEVTAPTRGFMPNRGQAAIGCGFPAAMGAKLAQPERTVVAFVGDGGFCQGLTELETAYREDIPVIVVLNNNSCLGYVKSLQHIVFDKRYKSADFTPIHFDKIAQDFNCRGIRLKSMDELVPELNKALDSGLPTVIDVPTITDPGQMLPKPDARAARC